MQENRMVRAPCFGGNSAEASQQLVAEIITSSALQSVDTSWVKSFS
jgi:hypothetical protein